MGQNNTDEKTDTIKPQIFLIRKCTPVFFLSVSIALLYYQPFFRLSAHFNTQQICWCLLLFVMWDAARKTQSKQWVCEKCKKPKSLKMLVQFPFWRSEWGESAINNHFNQTASQKTNLDMRVYEIYRKRKLGKHIKFQHLSFVNASGFTERSDEFIHRHHEFTHNTQISDNDLMRSYRFRMF